MKAQKADKPQKNIFSAINEKFPDLPGEAVGVEADYLLDLARLLDAIDLERQADRLELDVAAVLSVQKFPHGAPASAVENRFLGGDNHPSGFGEAENYPPL
jgi:hypothetical protein